MKLQVAEPALFASFSNHYLLMGEKSFDHAKKYWFNQLRRVYPLTIEAKPHAVRAESVSAMAVQGMAAAAAQNLDETLEKPKFTEDHLAELVEENVSVNEVSLAEEEKIITGNEKIIVATKPAFKPRFNAGNIKKTEVLVDQNTPQNDAKPQEAPEIKIEPAKPAFKPRFNIQNIKKEVVKEASAEDTTTETEVPQPVVEPTENQNVKPVYKPRFQMKNIPKPPAE